MQYDMHNCNRVPTQPGNHGKVREFENGQGNQGKVREFLIIVQKSQGKNAALDSKIAELRKTVTDTD